MIIRTSLKKCRKLCLIEEYFNSIEPTLCHFSAPLVRNGILLRLVLSALYLLR